VLLIVFLGERGSVLLIVFCFGTGIRVAHRFLFWEGDPCCSPFFVFGGGSILLIFFGRGIRVAHRFFVLGGGSVLLIVFLFWEGGLYRSLVFDLGGGSVLLIVFCFGRWIRVVHRF
jgi:hypothetical protein